ncbi:hypothetical protein N7491_006223 [Penicillium cf. griseofulvum]|uniref:GPI anchored serine-threonine rich protein n=1 Tax=Penicillium cf. griseofulvum TaxID=2972120 RepID=A0A9W9IXT4_9EURO|nr:hypothetical protein N7472_010747 [Penicillium cf. griseofulvum]KAJ5429207.1 hypothetical protein N7491_006223 [Penicillium cf. griseofulvum]KAJ5437001.1 hypothetical protein N7445_007886 [Penicillium cf. griseofulvum]
MHYSKSTLPFILVTATLASADTKATLADSVMSTTCASENILRQCIQSMQSNLENCAPDDWSCQCASSTNMVYCYKNCPEDSSKKDVESTRQQICANAKAYAPTSTAAFGVSSSMSSASTVSPTARDVAIMSTDIDDGTDISDSEENDFQEGHPKKLYSGLEANSIPRTEQGTASGLRVTGWFGFLGLALGVIF